MSLQSQCGGFALQRLLRGVPGSLELPVSSQLEVRVVHRLLFEDELGAFQADVVVGILPQDQPYPLEGASSAHQTGRSRRESTGDFDLRNEVTVDLLKDSGRTHKAALHGEAMDRAGKRDL